MKAKRQLFKAMFTLMGMFILASCSEKSESTIPEPQPPVGTKSLKVSPSSLSFSAAGGTEQLQVTTTYKYFGYDIDADWLSGAFKDDPTYNYITITAEPNSSSNARNANIKITASNNSTTQEEYVTVSISQEGAEKKHVSNAYMNYLSVEGLRADAVTLAQAACKLQLLKFEIYKNCTDNFNVEKNFIGDPKNANWDRFYEIAGELVDNLPAYEKAINRMEKMGVLKSKTPKTRVLTSIVNGIYGVHTVMDKASEKIMNTMRQEGMNNDEMWESVYNYATAGKPSLTLGCNDFREWRKKINRGDAGSMNASSIFTQLSNGNHVEFTAAAVKAGYGPNPAYNHTKEVAGKSVEAGADIVMSSAGAGSSIIGLGKDAHDLTEATGQFINAVNKGEGMSEKGREMLVTGAGVIANSIIGNDASYGATETVTAATTAAKETIIKDLNEVEAIRDANNDETGVIYLSDLTPVNGTPGILVATTPDNRTIVTTEEEGAAPLPTSETGDYEVTYIDGNGDKYTGAENVPTKGERRKVEVNTNEKEKIEADDSIEDEDISNDNGDDNGDDNGNDDGNDDGDDDNIYNDKNLKGNFPIGAWKNEGSEWKQTSEPYPGEDPDEMEFSDPTNTKMLLLYKDGPAVLQLYDEEGVLRELNGMWSLSGDNLQLSGLMFVTDNFVIESYSDESMVLRYENTMPTMYAVYDDKGNFDYWVDYTLVYDVRWTLRKVNATSNSRRAMQRAR